MNWGEWARRVAPWWEEDAPYGDVVLSSRVRLARNLHGRRFPHRLGEDELRRLREEIHDASLLCPSLQQARWWPLEELEELQRRFLLERHLISHELVEGAMGRGLLLVRDEAHGVMVHEEDHLRIQAFGAGLKIRETYEMAKRSSDELGESLKFARSPRLGWITACPSNLGTGLRASVLLHLPGLMLTGDLEKVLTSLRVLHVTVRGFWGEGTPAPGALFQVSNAVTMGLSETQILDDLLHHVRKVISVEKEARSVLLRQQAVALNDRVWRAWGILTNARRLNTREAFELLGEVRLGTSLDLLPGVDETALRSLLVITQAAHLQLAEGRELDARRRDEIRARRVREVLTGKAGPFSTRPRKDEE